MSDPSPELFKLNIHIEQFRICLHFSTLYVISANCKYSLWSGISRRVQFVGQLLTSETETRKTVTFFIIPSPNAKQNRFKQNINYCFPPYNVRWRLLLFCGTSLEKREMNFTNGSPPWCLTKLKEKQTWVQIFRYISGKYLSVMLSYNCKGCKHCTTVEGKRSSEACNTYRKTYNVEVLICKNGSTTCSLLVHHRMALSLFLKH